MQASLFKVDSVLKDSVQEISLKCIKKRIQQIIKIQHLSLNFHINTWITSINITKT